MTTTYTIKYSRTTNHIEGLDTACPTMNRPSNKLATGMWGTDLEKIFDHARTGSRQLCRYCTHAALAVLAQRVITVTPAAEIEVKEVKIVAQRGAHADCTHAATKTERAKCRRARAEKI